MKQIFKVLLIFKLSCFSIQFKYQFKYSISYKKLFLKVTNLLMQSQTHKHRPELVLNNQK